MAKQQRITAEDIKNAKIAKASAEAELKIWDDVLKKKGKISKADLKKIKNLETIKAKSQDILDIDKKQNVESDKAASKQNQKKIDLKEVKSIGKEILGIMQDQGESSAEQNLHAEVWAGVMKEVLQDTSKMGPIQKKYHATAKSGLAITKDIYAATADIGTAEFQSYDLSKQIAAAKKLGYTHTVDMLTLSQKINDANKRTHEQITAIGKEITKPFEKLDAVIRKLPFGDLLADIIGVKAMGDAMLKKFQGKVSEWRSGKGVAPGATPDVAKSQDKAGKWRMSKGQKGAGKFTSAPKDIGKEVGDEAGEEMGSGIVAKLKSKAGLIAKVLMIGIAIALALITKLFIGLLKNAIAMQKELGVGAGHAMDLGIATREAAAGSFIYGENLADVQARASILVTEWGIINQETKNSIVEANKLQRLYGVSTTAAAQIAAMMEATSTSTKDILLQDMQGQMAELQKEGIPVGKIMEEVASDTNFFAKHMKNGGKNVIKAAAFAKKLGMSMSTVSGAAEKLLDWETSINAEMEASVLLGREVNMEEARRLMFEGKHEEAMKAIIRQVGSEAEFNRMNVVQREALAEAAGVSVTDLTKMVAAEAKLGKLTSKERREQIKNAKVTKNIQAIWSKVVEIFQRLYKQFITPIAEYLMKILGFTGKIGDDLSKQKGVWKGIEKQVEKVFKWVSDIAYKFIDWFKKLGSVDGKFVSIELLLQNLWKKVVKVWDKFKGWLVTIGLIYAAIVLLPPIFAAMGAGGAAAGGGLAGLGTGLSALGGMAPLAAKGIGIIVLAMAGFALGIYLLAKAIEHGEKGFRIFFKVVGGFIIDVLGVLVDLIVRLAPHVVNLAAVVGGVLIDAFTIFKDLVIGIIEAISGLITGVFTSIYTTFEKFAEMGREGGLLSAALGIAAIGVALLGFGVGGGIGSIAGAIGDFFGGDPVKKFEKFGALGPSLTQTGEAMKTLTTSMQNFKDIGIRDMASATQELAKALVKLASASGKVNKAQRAVLRTQALKGFGQLVGLIKEDSPVGRQAGSAGGPTQADIDALRKAQSDTNILLMQIRDNANRNSQYQVIATEGLVEK